MLNKIFLRFHTGFTLSLIYVTLISHGRLTPKINIHLIASFPKISGKPIFPFLTFSFVLKRAKNT